MYAIEIWFPSSQKWRTKLENVQHFFLKQHQNNFVRTYSELLNAYNASATVSVSPIWRLSAQRSLQLFYRYYYGLRYCSNDCIPPVIGRRSGRTGHGQAVGMTVHRTVTTASTFFPTAIQIWNRLPVGTSEMGYGRFSSFLSGQNYTNLLRELSGSPAVNHVKYCCRLMCENYM